MNRLIREGFKKWLRDRVGKGIRAFPRDLSCLLWSATTEAETVRFNLINLKTNNRIKMKTVDAGTGEELSRGDLVKGFAVAKDEHVLLDKEDFESVKLKSTRIIDIEKFVARETIDRLYWDTPYHLVPSGKTGIEAFSVIREAMKRKGMVAIGRLVMSTRERVCAIEIEEDGLVLTTLRTAEEVRSLDEIGHPDLPQARCSDARHAEKTVAQQSGDFDPPEFTDRYEERRARDRGEARRASRLRSRRSDEKGHRSRRSDGSPEEKPVATAPERSAPSATPPRLAPTRRSRRREGAGRPDQTGRGSVQDEQDTGDAFGCDWPRHGWCRVGSARRRPSSGSPDIHQRPDLALDDDGVVDAVGLVEAGWRAALSCACAAPYWLKTSAWLP